MRTLLFTLLLIYGCNCNNQASCNISYPSLDGGQFNGSEVFFVFQGNQDQCGINSFNLSNQELLIDCLTGKFINAGIMFDSIIISNDGFQINEIRIFNTDLIPTELSILYEDYGYSVYEKVC